MKFSKRRNEIKQLTKLKLRDTEIAKILGITVQGLRWLRRQFNIKTAFKKGHPFKDFTELKKIICSILNKENPQYPLSDNSIAKILRKINVQISQPTIARLRYRMKIPSARGYRKEDLNRKYLYFTQSRYVWSFDSNHKRRKK